MTLEPGARFSSYEIAESIGTGGMGEVYRATDTTLEREVAVKVLPESFATDAERVARFEREAKTLASLNHSNIAQVYGLERDDGKTAIVMELVDGPTLADRIAEGPIPADEALGIARQIADALEAAHDRHIIHRDLKPANIKLRPDGTVKVLDFGIAKALTPDNLTGAMPSPIMTTPVTQAGIILGTAAYMSPEQARGKPVDKRTDVWAFGCVLYEMLTGQLAFGGEDVAVIMARVIANDTNMDSLPAMISPAVRHTIKLCLEKDPGKRIRDIGDVKLALAGAFEPDVLAAAAEETHAAPRSFWRRPLPVGAGMLVLGATVAWLVTAVVEPEPEPRPVDRFSYTLPADMGFRRQGENVIALSPDGRHFVMNTSAGLYLRSMDSLEGRLIAGTEEDLDTPFFSADSQSIGYWTPDGAIKRIGISGGAPVVVANDVGNPLGASWEANGTILIADERGVLRIAENGGTPEPVFAVAEGERIHAPQLLPDGNTVLYSVADGFSWDAARIVVHSISSGERKVLIEGGSAARYVDTGHIVYALGNDLFAMAFDPDSLTVSGRIVPMLQGVSRASFARAGLANYGVSGDGRLVYLADSEGLSAALTPVWVDRNGREDPVGMRSCNCFEPRVSPDGMRIAFRQPGTSDDAPQEIWIWSIPQETFTRLTFESQAALAPVWSPDGESIAYGGPDGIFVRRADGTGTAQRLLESAGLPDSWSADGEIVYWTVGANQDIHALSVATDPMPRTLLATPFSEIRPELSPDGRWLAYSSNESGRHEVYVRPYPDVDAGRWQISTDGGTTPQWSTDSGTLYFIGPDEMMATTVTPGASFSFTRPEPLFILAAYNVQRNNIRGYAVSADGERLLMLKRPATADAEIVVVLNWTGELERLVPAE